MHADRINQMKLCNLGRNNTDNRVSIKRKLYPVEWCVTSIDRYIAPQEPSELCNREPKSRARLPHVNTPDFPLE